MTIWDYFGAFDAKGLVCSTFLNQDRAEGEMKNVGFKLM